MNVNYPILTLPIKPLTLKNGRLIRTQTSWLVINLKINAVLKIKIKKTREFHGLK